MRNIKIIIEYKGTNYHGWATQPNVITIQGEIEKSLEALTGESIRIIGAGRTDSGVHAVGQVASFYTDSDLNTGVFPKALSARLPKDIRIIDAQEADRSFNANLSAKRKLYLYNVFNDRNVPFCFEDYVYVDSRKLDLDLMGKASGLFVGEHDFTSFCVDDENRKSNIRNIFSFEVAEQNIPGYLNISDAKYRVISFFVSGNGFLHKMVRFMVGAILDVGCGKLDVADIGKMLGSKKRGNMGYTVPGSGLCLVKVDY